MSGVFQVGGPWLATVNNGPLEEQAAAENIGDRAQNLVFIGMNMETMKPKIEEVLDQCLVTDEEWKDMLKNEFTLEIEVDPFEA